MVTSLYPEIKNNNVKLKCDLCIIDVKYISSNLIFDKKNLNIYPMKTFYGFLANKMNNNYLINKLSFEALNEAIVPVFNYYIMMLIVRLSLGNWLTNKLLEDEGD